MLRLELGQIIDILIDYDPQVLGCFVRRHLAFCERLGHGDRSSRQPPSNASMRVQEKGKTDKLQAE